MRSPYAEVVYEHDDIVPQPQQPLRHLPSAVLRTATTVGLVVHALLCLVGYRLAVEPLRALARIRGDR